MSRYSDWMTSQDPSFVKEVCGDNKPSVRFKDYCFIPVSLEELEELDNKYINKESETL